MHVSENEEISHVVTHDGVDASHDELDSHAEPVSYLIEEGKKGPEDAFVIQDIHDEHQSQENVNLSTSHSEESTEALLAKIFDIKPTADKSLLAIKDVVEVEHHLIDQSFINPENIEEQMPDMVRLRLLKTGTLHDMVLPQGTIISTNFADAEELISSGTAEKLLIQTEPADH